MKSIVLSAIAFVAVVASQVVPDACIQNCTLQYCALTDFTCTCGSNSTQIGACIAQKCPASDIDIALSLQAEVCSMPPIPSHPMSMFRWANLQLPLPPPLQMEPQTAVWSLVLPNPPHPSPSPRPQAVLSLKRPRLRRAQRRRLLLPRPLATSTSPTVDSRVFSHWLLRLLWLLESLPKFGYGEFNWDGKII